MSKYKVVKVGGDPFHEELEEDEYFVLRRQDVFGAQALYGYAHLLQSAVELDSQRGFLSQEERQRLEVAADEVSGIADKWRRSPSKIPD